MIANYVWIIFLLNIFNTKTRLLCYPRPQLLVLSQQWEHQHNMRNLFKVKNKDARTPSLGSVWSCLYCLFWTGFTHCPGVSIVNFEQVNTSWETKGRLLNSSCSNHSESFEFHRLVSIKVNIKNTRTTSKTLSVA